MRKLSFWKDRTNCAVPEIFLTKGKKDEEFPLVICANNNTMRSEIKSCLSILKIIIRNSEQG